MHLAKPIMLYFNTYKAAKIDKLYMSISLTSKTLPEGCRESFHSQKAVPVGNNNASINM